MESILNLLNIFNMIEVGYEVAIFLSLFLWTMIILTVLFWIFNKEYLLALIIPIVIFSVLYPTMWANGLKEVPSYKYEKMMKLAKKYNKYPVFKEYYETFCSDGELLLIEYWRLYDIINTINKALKQNNKAKIEMAQACDISLDKKKLSKDIPFSDDEIKAGGYKEVANYCEDKRVGSKIKKEVQNAFKDLLIEEDELKKIQENYEKYKKEAIKKECLTK